MGGILWEESCMRNPVREESRVGGIPFGRNPMWEESWWEESHGMNPMGGIPWEESRGRKPGGRNPMGGIPWEEFCMGGIPMEPIILHFGCFVGKIVLGNPW